MENYWCIYCENLMQDSACVPCNEYKGAVTFAEFVEINGYEPKAVA